MTQITIFGKQYTILNQKSKIDCVGQKEDTIIIESLNKPEKTLLNEFLSKLLYDKLFNIYDQIRKEGKIETLGDLDFEIIEKIDGKKERIAKQKGNRILVKLDAVVLPNGILRYVVAHELAHSFTRRHTKRFWKIVELICPNYKKAQQSLTECTKLMVI